MPRIPTPAKNYIYTHAYLHSNRALEIIARKNFFDKKTNSIQFLEYRNIILDPFPKMAIDFVGRIVIHEMGFIGLLSDCKYLSAAPKTLENGSTFSKENGIEVGNIIMKNKFGRISFSLTSFISDPITYQPEVNKTIEEIKNDTTWGDIVNIW